MRNAAVLAVCLAMGCSSIKAGAVQSAVAAKTVVDGAADSWSAFVDCKISECSHLESREDKIECLGIAASAKDVEILFETIYAAQLAIFIAVSSGDSIPATLDAVKDLTISVKNLINFFDKNNLSLKEITSCPKAP